MTFPTKYLILISILSPPRLALEAHHLAKGEKKNKNLSWSKRSKHQAKGPACILQTGLARRDFSSDQLLREFNIIRPPIKLIMEVQYQQLL